jgi:peptidoglycan/LPS O-acetylase OafA/YrhL
MQTTGMILFVVFALVLAASYLGIRRRWAQPAAVAAVSVLASFVIMMLIGLSQGNSIYQAIFVGLLVGGLCSGGILGMAWYFQRAERRGVAMPELNDLPPDAKQE